jgi:hypothetical protein
MIEARDMGLVSPSKALPICLDLLAQVGSFITVAKVSQRDIHAMTSKQACGDRAETATCTSDQGYAIV